MGGEVQGKAHVPALYTLDSFIFLESHKSIAPGLCLQSYMQSNTTMWHTPITQTDMSPQTIDSESPMESVIEYMRESEKKWNNLIMILGGSLALHRTSWRILALEMVHG